MSTLTRVAGEACSKEVASLAIIMIIYCYLSEHVSPNPKMLHNAYVCILYTYSV